MVDDASDASDIVVIVGTTRTGLSREGPACIHADTWLACGVGSVMMGSAVMTDSLVLDGVEVDTQSASKILLTNQAHTTEVPPRSGE